MNAPASVKTPARLKQCYLLQDRAKFFYKICRLLHIYNFRYDPQKAHLLHPEALNKCWRIVTSTFWIIIVLSLLNNTFIRHLCIAIFSDKETQQFLKDELQQHNVLTILQGMAVAYRIYRTLRKLRQPNEGKLLLPLLNELLQLHALVQQVTRRNVHVHRHLVWLLRCKQLLLLLQIVWCIKMCDDTLVALLDVALYEFVYYAWQTLHLTVLSLQHELNVDTAAQLQRCKKKGRKHLQCKRLQHILLLLQRVRMAHGRCWQHFTWFCTLTFSCVFSNICYLNRIYFCYVLGALEFTRGTAWELLVFVALPWLNLLMLTLLNDAIVATVRRTHELLVMIVLHVPVVTGRRCRDCDGLQKALDTLIFDEQLQSDTRYVYVGSKLDRKFVFSYAELTLMFAIGCAQNWLKNNPACNTT